ncbi:RNA polymerase sigma factor sigF chloroplastic [Bienertia sinuspersici]
MEAAINILSSSSSFPPRTHFRNNASSPPPPSVSIYNEQISVVSATLTTSMTRQFPAPVVSHEQRDEYKPSLSVLKEDKTCQLLSTSERQKIEHAAFSQQPPGTAVRHQGDFEHHHSFWPSSAFLLPSLGNEEQLDVGEPINLESFGVISLAEEALLASKFARSLAESSDALDAATEEPLSSRSNTTPRVIPKTVRSSRRLERRNKKRKGSRPRVVHEMASTEKKADSRRSSEGYDPNDPLRLFLWGPETKQLLTIQEENKLIRDIQEYNKLVAVKTKLESQFDREPTYSEWADAVGMSSGELRSEVLYGKRSREKLIYANFRMVVYIAKQYQGRGLNLKDLLQVIGQFDLAFLSPYMLLPHAAQMLHLLAPSLMGLMKSVEKFKPQAGCRFSSYAYWWIRQGIRKAIFQHSKTIRVPENMYSLHAKVLEARKSFIQEGHHQPTTEEIARRVGITVEKLQNLLFMMTNPLSMQQTVWTDQNTTFQVMNSCQ